MTTNNDATLRADQHIIATFIAGRTIRELEQIASEILGKPRKLPKLKADAVAVCCDILTGHISD